MLSLPIVFGVVIGPAFKDQVEPCDFCVRGGDFFSIGSAGRTKIYLKDSNVTAIMLTTPCRVSGDHPSLTLIAKIFLPVVSPPLHVG